MSDILSNTLRLVGLGSSVGDGGKMNNLFIQINLFMFCHWAYYLLRLIKKKKELAKSMSESEFSSSSPVSCIHVLMLMVPLLRGFSLLLKLLCSPSLPLIVACNVLSETPLLLLFVLILNGWPLVKPHLLLKDKLLLVSLVLMECFMVPTFMGFAFRRNNNYTPNQCFEFFDILRVAFLFQALNSSTCYLKKKGLATSGQAPFSVYYIELFGYLDMYYCYYWLVRALVAYNFNLILNELLYLILCVAFARKFLPELLNTTDWLGRLIADDDGDFVDVLLNSNDNYIIVDDQKIANYMTTSGFRFFICYIVFLALAVMFWALVPWGLSSVGV